MRAAALTCLALLLPAAPARAAEDLLLVTRQQAGDVNPLSLRVHILTEATRNGVEDRDAAEDVKLSYGAAVTVLEVDAGGRALRERHEAVRLSFERPGESGSLFADGATLEVRRLEDLQVFVGNARAERAVEKVVADVLAYQFRYTLEPALLDPRRPVEVGASWSLDASLARRFLLARGVRVIDFGRRGTATLQRRWHEDAGMELVVEYEVPVARFELARMPLYADARSSEARLAGRIRLGPQAGAPPIAWTSQLSLRLSGASTPLGADDATVALPWTLHRTVHVEQEASAAPPR
jgi:hypothetical protein